jgi:hypothetical protein
VTLRVDRLLFLVKPSCSRLIFNEKKNRPPRGLKNRFRGELQLPEGTMVGIVASRRQRAHRYRGISAQALDRIYRSILERKIIGGVLIGAISICLLVAGATVTLAESSAKSHSKPVEKPSVTKGIPLPPSPPASRDVNLTVPLPSPELLERQREPDCEIPASDRLLGAVPETTRLIYERQCYKNAETVVREKLQLLQDAIAGTVKALNESGASKILQPAVGGEQGIPAKEATTAPKADATDKGSQTAGNAGERSDAESDPSGDQEVEPPDQHRKPSARSSINLSARESDAPKSSVAEGARRERTGGTPTPVSGPGKPVMASAKGVCQTSKPAAGHGPWAWRLIDGRKCWYEGAAGMDKSLLRWPSVSDIPELW